ncbi:hypothetical protein [Kingella denitrificans]|uniref:hypothetical protein n=1 Tax=Kingella denitrificans TaxID=502 RepID=UPI000B99CD45|nr:hypothetical protein [Kingella denitrificans]
MLTLLNMQTKGYEDFIEIDGKLFFRQFAIKKNNEDYLVYFYIVQEDKLDQAEDYEIEEFNQFNKIKPALDFIKTKGADLSKFSVFKGNKPI